MSEAMVLAVCVDCEERAGGGPRGVQLVVAWQQWATTPRASMRQSTDRGGVRTERSIYGIWKVIGADRLNCRQLEEWRTSVLSSSVSLPSEKGAGSRPRAGLYFLRSTEPCWHSRQAGSRRDPRCVSLRGVSY